MKTMTCTQLGGAHLKVMGEMKELMQKPGAMEVYFAEKRKAFDETPLD